MTTTPVAQLPGGVDFDEIVAQALEDPEIVAGAQAAGLRPEDLRGDVSRQQTLEAVPNDLSAAVATDARVEEARRAQPPARRGYVPGAGSRTTLRPPRSGGQAPDSALAAEHGAAVERLRTALREQVLGQLRTAVEVRAADSYSTLLKVDTAPGLAQLVDDDYGVQTRATKELTALFGRMPGGSIGLAGRRGIGKSKLIQRMCPPPLPAQEASVLATVVSAPTLYDGRDFVLHLFARLCETVVGGPEARARRLAAAEQSGPRMPASERRARVVARLRLPALCLGIAAIAAAAADLTADPLLVAGAAFAGVALLLKHPWLDYGHGVPVGVSGPAVPLLVVGLALIAGSLPERDADPLLSAGILVVALALVALLTPLSGLLGPRHERGSGVFSDELVATAHARLDDIQYQRTIAAGWTSGGSAKLGAGPAELGLQTAVSGTRTLAESPLSFPEIVERLRAFLRQAAASVEVRIGIDELDKIESEETAHRFLNEIKAVFGIPRCYFLVSVSEEAMANFDRRGAKLRDVFDSSFDEILYVPPLTFAESLQLMRQRVIGLPVPYHALCHVLSGGLPRDLIRVARAMIAVKPPDRDGELAEVATALIALELEQRVRAVSVVVANIRLEPKSSAFLLWAGGLTADVTAAGLLARCARLEPFGDVTPEEYDVTDRSAHVQLAGMTIELMTFCYFAATVIEFFDQLVATRTKLTEYRWDELEQLTAARGTSAANPRVGWGLVSAFRASQSMAPCDLPRAVEHRPTFATDPD